MLVAVEDGCLEEIWVKSRVHLGKKKEYTPANRKETKAAKSKEDRKKQEEKKG